MSTLLHRTTDNDNSDWSALGQRLIVDYDDVSLTAIVRELASARSAATSFGVTDDLMELTETLTRRSLDLLSGRAGEAARLDPEHHDRGVEPAARGADSVASYGVRVTPGDSRA